VVDRIDVESGDWVSLARHAPLGILSDLDGTLLPFADTPDAARPSEAVLRLVRALGALPGVQLTIVSGRSPAVLDELFPAPRDVLLVAEHGAWHSGPDGWKPMLSVEAGALDTLATELASVRARYPAVLVERKTWSLAVHLRRVPEHEKMGALIDATALIDPWLAGNPEFEDLAGDEVVEIRPRRARKSNAVGWVRSLLGPQARLIVVGDDATDEDMFLVAGPSDATIHVGDGFGTVTSARWTLRSVDEVCAFYEWIVATRSGTTEPASSTKPSRVDLRSEAHGARTFYDLLVVSNRLPPVRSDGTPNRKRSVSGLVSALRPALAARKGIWLGWSGRSRAESTESAVALDVVDGLSLAAIDFPDEWRRLYYDGFSNSALWPLLHSFPGRVRFSHAAWASYVRASEAFAAVAARLVAPQAKIWAHDYHLMLLGRSLRRRDHRGPIGMFQHVPFPGPDIFFLCPWAADLLGGMLDFDLVGFHTPGYAKNFLQCVSTLPGVTVESDRVLRGGRATRVGAFPLGTIPEDFQDTSAAASEEVAGLVRAIAGTRMVLGVDRLDYTKGIPERISAFGTMLERYEAWRGKVCLVQIAVPSRADIPEYAEQRARVESIVARVNADYGAGDWVPIRYLYRSYGRAELTHLYRAADVGYVTPLRDGMNLVAKEYVAAQDPERPGVLLLSRFAGAAEELREALLTNPWDREGMAHDLDVALRMSAEERVRRHASLLETVSRSTALTWAESFLAALEGPGTPVARLTT
jgi:alpha,alpha-trehalose-phosphate synthase [UDP-forming]/trehalose-phosphatase